MINYNLTGRIIQSTRQKGSWHDIIMIWQRFTEIVVCNGRKQRSRKFDQCKYIKYILAELQEFELKFRVIPQIG